MSRFLTPSRASGKVILLIELSDNFTFIISLLSPYELLIVYKTPSLISIVSAPKPIAKEVSSLFVAGFTTSNLSLL
ncbi:hypothetical protein D3C86_1776710 [compost metagenome]